MKPRLRNIENIREEKQQNKNIQIELYGEFGVHFYTLFFLNKEP